MNEKKYLAMFPGQGSQYVGMGRQLLAEFPYTARIFEEAEDASNSSIRRLCLEGPEDQLKRTENTQPCLVTVSIATWTVLEKEIGFKADLFAGHSLGEFSALVAAQRISFGEAICLVKQRGIAMQKAVPEGVGAMTAVLSCEAERLESFCKESSRVNEPVEVVNYNSPAQLVVAGDALAVERLEETLKTSGVKFIRLAVSAPFHSSLMAPARIEMTPLLQKAKFTQRTSPIIPNLTAEIVTNYGSAYLVKQIDSPVKWTQTIEKAQLSGITQFVEVGPGRVLVGLSKRILPKGEWTIQSTDDVAAFLKL
ncbi:MAG: ACP S-malonyltransferase [Proteobacteria bacterium]|nr:ACP S-malonyltransferase [Pseudomonadota bacterium]